MLYRNFPGTNVRASEIGFGTWTLSTGWWGEKTDEEAVEMLRTAHSKYGVNFFDTADTYGNGRGERQIAQAFRGKRSDVFYSSKIGYDIYDPTAQSTRRGQSELPQKFDRDYMRFALDKCLERLETDHVDVLQLHNIKMDHVRDATIWQTLGQAALKWLLAEPLVVTTLPNIYDLEQLEEFATASDKPDLSWKEMQRVAELAAHNFDMDEEPMSYKGTMQRVSA